MATTTAIPLWVALVIAVASPLLAFTGVLLAQWLARRASLESEVRWRREETMRMLRWAAELAAADAPERAAVGVAALAALEKSELLQKADQDLISSVLESVVEPVEDAYNEGDLVTEGQIDA